MTRSMLSLILRCVAAPLLALALAAPLAAQPDNGSLPDDTVAADSPATAIDDTTTEEDTTGAAPVAPGTAAIDTAELRRIVDATLAARGPARLPGPWFGALVVVAIAGALGGLAGDIVTDGGRIGRFRKDGDVGWFVGWPGNLIVGAVAALIACGLRPPGGGWSVLVGTALAVGVGSEAFLKAIIAGFQTREAQTRAAAIAVTAIELQRAKETPPPATRARLLSLGADLSSVADAASAAEAEAKAYEASLRRIAEKMDVPLP